MSRSRSRRAALSLAAAAALALGAEVALRAAGIAAPPPERPDLDLGWAPQERPLLLPKAPGVWRVALLGDERAHEVQPRLSALIAERAAGRRVEVLDFAVAGYGTAQHYVQLQSRVMRYRPDLVVLAFNAANDVRNNSFFLEPRKDRPFFFLDERGALVVDASFAGSASFAWKTSLRARLLGKSRLAQLFLQAGEPAPLAGDAAAWAEAKRVTKALLAGCAALARRDGAELVVLNVPDEIGL